MLIEFFNRIDEIPVERHDALRDLEWCEQPDGSAVVGEGPT
jgi:hypothetical protein